MNQKEKLHQVSETKTASRPPVRQLTASWCSAATEHQVGLRVSTLLCVTADVLKERITTPQESARKRGLSSAESLSHSSINAPIMKTSMLIILYQGRTWDLCGEEVTHKEKNVKIFRHFQLFPAEKLQSNSAGDIPNEFMFTEISSITASLLKTLQTRPPSGEQQQQSNNVYMNRRFQCFSLKSM